MTSRLPSAERTESSTRLPTSRKSYATRSSVPSGFRRPSRRLAWLESLGDSAGERPVVINGPAAPEYYSNNMDLSVIIDRGDIWYEFPYDDQGRERPQPVQRRPMLTLFTTYLGEKDSARSLRNDHRWLAQRDDRRHRDVEIQELAGRSARLEADCRRAGLAGTSGHHRPHSFDARQGEGGIRQSTCTRLARATRRRMGWSPPTTRASRRATTARSSCRATKAFAPTVRSTT